MASILHVTLREYGIGDELDGTWDDDAEEDDELDDCW